MIVCEQCRKPCQEHNPSVQIDVNIGVYSAKYGSFARVARSIEGEHLFYSEACFLKFVNENFKEAVSK